MRRDLERRIERLERGGGRGGDLPVWCDDEADVETTIAAMVAAGEILEGDRPRCVHWTKANCPPGRHEAALQLLDAEATR